MKKTVKILRVAYVIVILLSVWFEFLAIINDKFGERIGTYAILYGLVVLPQILLNIIIKILARRNRLQKNCCVGDLVQLITAVVVLRILIPMCCTSDDIIFIIPWVVVLVLNVIIYFYFKRTQ